MKGLMRTALWTELLEALRKDYPDVEFSNTAGPGLSRVIQSNADFMFELSEKAQQKPTKETPWPTTPASLCPLTYTWLR